MAKGKLAQRMADAKAAGWAHYIRGENDERAVLAGCRVEESLGQHVCEFFRRYLRHSKGEWAGQRFELTPIQRDLIVMPLFSWVRPDGRRRFRTADIWVPKKNFKSTLAAGLGLYGLRADCEPGAEVYAAAVDRKQAGIVFGEAANMVDASPALRSKLVVTRSTKTINYGHKAWFKALSAEFATHEGLNPHFTVVDEIHAFDERGRQLFQTLMYGGAARRQPLRIVISTAGDDETTIGYEQYEYAKGVRDGIIDDTTAFVYIAEALPEEDWTDPAIWAKANPSLGTIIQAEEMSEECNKARQSPRLQASFKRYRLNMWIRTSEPWLDMERWQACGQPVDYTALAGETCCGGLDLSTVRDLSAFVLAFRSDGDGNETEPEPTPAPSHDPSGNVPGPHGLIGGIDADDAQPIPVVESDPDAIYTLLPFFWLPEDGIRERERIDRVPYRQWADAGYLKLTPGNTIDYSFIEQAVVSLAKQYDIHEIAFDPYNATDLVHRLAENHGLTMVEMRQGYLSLSDPSKTFERLVLSGRLRHGNNPILRWMANHVSIATDPAGNIKPVKPDRNRGSKRIDGIVASIMGLAREAMRDGSGGSVYNTRGPLVLDF